MDGNSLLWCQVYNRLMIEKPQPKITNIKTYVRGAFLYSQNGFGYQQKQKDTQNQMMEKIVEDKIGISDVKKQMAEKKKQIKRKKQSKNEKPVLIPIRDTPVEPVPEPINDNQKCERAIQDQFQYFQSYINLKEKQRKFQEEQQMRLEFFALQQQMYKQEQGEKEAPNRGITLVMEKEESKSKKKTLMKIKIKKKDHESQECYEQISKIRVLE